MTLIGRSVSTQLLLLGRLGRFPEVSFNGLTSDYRTQVQQVT